MLMVTRAEFSLGRDFPGRACPADILGVLRGLFVGYSDHHRGKLLATVASHHDAVVVRE